MQKVDGYDLYKVGAALQKLHELKGDFSENTTIGTEYQKALYDLWFARHILKSFLQHEAYRLAKPPGSARKTAPPGVFPCDPALRALVPKGLIEKRKS